VPANHKVSVAWQIVFTFLPIVNLWAFYRIRKLTKYVLYVIVPSIAISIILYTYFFYYPALRFTPWGDDGLAFGDPTPSYVSAASNVIAFGLQGLAIYLVIIWSRLDNRRVDASRVQAPPPITTENPITQRPIAIVILAILTFLTLSPVLAGYLMRDPLEVAFKYPSPDPPSLDTSTYIALVITVSLSQGVLFIVSIIAGIGVLKKQSWSWFVGTGMHAYAISLYHVAILFLPPYTSYERIAFITISASALYLLSRSDVRTYLSRQP
jgi:hypothetical protein